MDPLVHARRADPAPHPGPGAPCRPMAVGGSGEPVAGLGAFLLVDPVREAVRPAVPGRRRTRSPSAPSSRGRTWWTPSGLHDRARPDRPAGSRCCCGSAGPSATSADSCSGWCSSSHPLPLRGRSPSSLPHGAGLDHRRRHRRLHHPGADRRRALGAALPALRRRADRRGHRHLGRCSRRSWWRPTRSWSGSAPGGANGPVSPAVAATVGALAAAGLAFPLRAGAPGPGGPAFQPARYDARRVIGAALAAEEAGIDVESVLREALHDPELTVAYPGPDGAWVRADGSPAAAGGHVDVDRHGRVVARVGFDPDRDRRRNRAPGRGTGRRRARQRPAPGRAGPAGRRDRRVARPAGHRPAPGAAPDRARPARRRPAVAARAGLRAPVRPAQRRPGADAPGAGRGRRRRARPRSASCATWRTGCTPPRWPTAGWPRRSTTWPATPPCRSASRSSGDRLDPGHRVHGVVGDRRGRGQRAEARRGPRDRGRRAAAQRRPAAAGARRRPRAAPTPTGPGCAGCATGSRRREARLSVTSGAEGTTVEAVLPCGS